MLQLTHLLTLCAVVQQATLALSQKPEPQAIPTLSPEFWPLFSPSTLRPIDLYPQTRIVGGQRAQIGQFPHQVSLRYENYHICGGSIIARSYVVTAAHCVQSGNRVTPPSVLQVQAGSLRLDGGGIFVRVAQIYVHPSYDLARVTYDVAVLRLSTPLSFDSNIGAIPLASTDPPPNSLVRTSGWGRVSQRGRISNELLYIDVRAISRATCQRYLQLSESILCLLHGSNTGVCQGDSGGPAVYNGQLIGVTSFVLGECARAAPDGFARVSAAHAWLRQTARL